MEGIEQLRREALRRAKAEAERIIEEARREAERIIREAEERRRRRLKELKVMLERGVESHPLVVKAKIEYRKRLAAAKTNILSRLEAEVRRNLEDPELRRQALVRLYREALETGSFPPGGIRIRVSPRDLEEARRLLGGEEVVEEIVADNEVDGGVVLESLDGTIRVDNTFKTRISRLLERKGHIIIGEILGGETDS